MNIFLGLLIIAIGSFGQSSSYVPITKIKEWSWESFWLTQGIFAWLVFPFLGALLSVPEGNTLFDIITVNTSASLKALGCGVLWGIGGLTFGLSMRYLGVALGQSISLGTCSAFGTLIPAVLSGGDVFSGEGLTLLIGVSITITGIVIIGIAGSMRSSGLSDEERKKAIKDFALTKGLLVALLAGVMSACFALGLSVGEDMIIEGGSDLFKTLPATFMVTCGGFLTNAAYCLYSNYKNKTFKDYGKSYLYKNNILFCALAGALWYSQFFGLGIGKSFLAEAPLMLAFSWSILMSLNVIFSNVWGVILKEWKGSSNRTILVLVLGILVLILSTIFPELIKTV